MASSVYQNTRQLHSGHSIQAPFLGLAVLDLELVDLPEVWALLAVDLVGDDAAGLGTKTSAAGCSPPRPAIRRAISTRKMAKAIPMARRRSS